MMKGDSPTVVNAYAVVSVNEDEENGLVLGGCRNSIATLPYSDHVQAAEVVASMASMPVEQNHSSCHDMYRSLPEASSLQWNDDFFAQEDDIVAVFDLDYDAVWAYYTLKLSSTFLGICLYFAVILWFVMTPTIIGYMFLSCCLLSLVTAFHLLRSANAQHVAITSDGVRFVVDRYRLLGVWSWTECGKTTKTVRTYFSF
jgi:hypothetical protein